MVIAVFPNLRYSLCDRLNRFRVGQRELIAGRILCYLCGISCDLLLSNRVADKRTAVMELRHRLEHIGVSILCRERSGVELTVAAVQHDIDGFRSCTIAVVVIIPFLHNRNINGCGTIFVCQNEGVVVFLFDDIAVTGRSIFCECVLDLRAFIEELWQL